MSVRRKSPQEKKALSLKKDRRNGYGANAKASRKTIPLKKAQEHRKTRHRSNQAVALVDRLEEGAAALVESSVRHDIHRVGGWTKGPDVALELAVRSGLEMREQRVNAKARRREDQAEQGARWEAHLSALRETAP